MAPGTQKDPENEDKTKASLSGIELFTNRSMSAAQRYHHQAFCQGSSFLYGRVN